MTDAMNTIEVFLGGNGTQAECGCGWKSPLVPPGVLPDVAFVLADKHTEETRHRLATRAEVEGV
jgi:hypothetical protein